MSKLLSQGRYGCAVSIGVFDGVVKVIPWPVEHTESCTGCVSCAYNIERQTIGSYYVLILYNDVSKQMLLMKADFEETMAFSLSAFI